MGKLWPIASLFAVQVLWAMPANAPACPAPFDAALRLILVTTPSMHTSSASMRLFTRTAVGAPWKQFGGVEPVAVGEAGLGWGYTFDHLARAGEPRKVEGDRRTPAGIFPLGSSFGFEESSLAGHVLIKAGETVCVEDPSSPSYNTITRRAEIGPGVHADDMRRSPLYRRGLFVEYPTDRQNRRGSCIFIHILDPKKKGTAGCVTLPEEGVVLLEEFARSGALLAVFPEFALGRFSGCLPDSVR